MAKNVHKVPTKQWNRWSKKAQRAFNWMFFLLREPSDIQHPAAPRPKRNHWSTVRWNAAWLAAQVTDGKS